MFNNHNFYIFVLLFFFGILLALFNGYVDHYRFIDIVTWILIAVPVVGFTYLLKFHDADVNAFYVFFSMLLVFYVLVFAGVRIYALFNPEASQSI